MPTEQLREEVARIIDRITEECSYSTLDRPMVQFFVTEIIAAIEAAGWQSIDTAPRDGTRILSVDQVGWHDIVRWEQSSSRSGGFWQDTQFDIPEFDLMGWRPLPAPPAGGGDE